jgi:metallophosphoesterase (TIGR00282 family)
LVEREGIDLVVANAENSAGGSGLSVENYRELTAAGIEAITLGDHVYKRREIVTVLERRDNIVKPANLAPDAPGRTWMTVEARDGTKVGIFCVLGQLFMKPADSPFRTADRVLAEMPDDVRVRLVDFHAEATSETQQLARHLDGRVSAVLGTHTHVPTADECVLPGGTAFVCDVGMTGPYESSIGRRIDRVLETTLTGNPTKFDVATGDARLCGAIVEVDAQTGQASRIRRVCVREEESDG